MARSKAQKTQAAENLAKMWNRRCNNGDQENEPPIEAVPRPNQEHVVVTHWNTVCARKENALKINLEKQKLETAKRELRNAKYREQNLRKKNTELAVMEANHQTD